MSTFLSILIDNSAVYCRAFKHDMTWFKHGHLTESIMKAHFPVPLHGAFAVPLTVGIILEARWQTLLDQCMHANLSMCLVMCKFW